jgi:cytoskeletal protein CcmA (bactofilin family)
MESPKTGEMAHIGKSVVIKGELSGSEDLYLDGRVQGTIELHGHNITIGPNGQVQANINAKGVFVQGKVDGDVQASDRVELRKTAVMMGDIVTQRVAIEDGAYLKGKVDIQKQAAKFEVTPETKAAAAKEVAVAQPVAAAVTAGSGSTSGGVQTAKAEQKK